MNHQPATISSTIMAAVIHITSHVLRSAVGLATSNTCSCCHGRRSWVCIKNPSLQILRDRLEFLGRAARGFRRRPDDLFQAVVDVVVDMGYMTREDALKAMDVKKLTYGGLTDTPAAG